MEPHKYASNNIQGAVSEIMSALSSLAMEPQEREHQPDDIFLCDIDHWAHHACEHLYQAVAFLGRESQQAPPLDGMSIYDVERLLRDIRLHLFTLEGGLDLKRAAAEIELAICTLEGITNGFTGSVKIKITTLFNEEDCSVTRSLKIVDGDGLNAVSLAYFGTAESWETDKDLMVDTIELPDGVHTLEYRDHKWVLK